MIDRRAQFHQSRLAEQQGTGLLSLMVSRQSRFYAYMDIYVIFGVMALVALPFIFLMRRSVAKGGVAPH